MLTPSTILETLLPSLIQAAKYAKVVQSRIVSLEEKTEATNIFAAALSDADIAIQNSIEVALLSRFPEVPFFGEEWKSSRNTKYLSAMAFRDDFPYLVTLDPVDGTRPYIDNHELYQVILTVVSREAIEAAIALFPSFGDYVYAIRGKGAFRGTFDAPFSAASRWKKGKSTSRFYLSGTYSELKDRFTSSFEEVQCSADYKKGTEHHSFSAFLRHELEAGINDFSQIIDGAALAFIAEEMGYFVRTHEGAHLPRPVDYPDLILPGVIVAQSEEQFRKIQLLAGKEKSA